MTGVLPSWTREPADRGLLRDGRHRAIRLVEPPAWTPKIGPRKAGCCRPLRPRSSLAGGSWSCLGRGAYIEEIARGSGPHVTNTSRSGLACVKKVQSARELERVLGGEDSLTGVRASLAGKRRRAQRSLPRRLSSGAMNELGCCQGPELKSLSDRRLSGPKPELVALAGSSRPKSLGRWWRWRLTAARSF